MSATALRTSPLLTRFLAEDFSVLIVTRRWGKRLRFVGWRRPARVLH